MAINAIQDFRNGLGYIYVTETDGTTFVSVYPNTCEGGDDAQKLVYNKAPLAGNIAATGRLTLSGAIGTLTSVTVNGVNILGSTATGATLADIVADAANIINNYTSVPDYKAMPSGDTLIIFALSSAGSGPNNYVVASATTGGMIATPENMRGGADTYGLYDQSCGLRVFLNADYDADGCAGEGTASATSLTNAVEITKYLINRGFQNDFIRASATIDGGTLELERQSNTTMLAVDTEGGAGTDNLQSITTEGFNENDILILRGANSGRITTVKNFVGGSDNIYLANSQDFATGTSLNAIALRLKSGAWYEEFRSPFTEVNVAFLRSVGIAMPVQGVEYTSLPTSGNITLTPGTDKQYQILGDSPVLVGNVAVIAGGTPIDGDEFWVDYIATAVTGGVRTVSIFGQLLTDTQATSGKLTVYAKYRLADNDWKTTFIYNTKDVDLVTTTTAYSRVLEAVNSGATNPAVGTQQTLASYTLPANAFANDQSLVKIKAYFTAAANANAKNFYVYFGATQVAKLEGAVNNNVVVLEASVTRLTSATQFASGTAVAEGGFINIQNSAPAEDLTAGLDIELRCQSPGSFAADITLDHYSIEYVAKV
jgi:hypothetical protein